MNFKEVRNFKSEDGDVYSVCYLGQSVIAYTDGHIVHVLDLKTPKLTKLVHEFGSESDHFPESDVLCMCRFKDDVLATGCVNGNVNLWDLKERLY